MTEIQFTPAAYQAQLEEKQERMRSMFAKYQPPELESYASPIKHYRMRAEFRVWHEGDDLYYIMFDQATKQKYRVDAFPQASKLINELMPALLEKLKPNTILRHKLFQVDFLSTKSGEAVISLLYHKQLDDEWMEAAKALRSELRETWNINLIGRARKQKVNLEQDFVVEQLEVDGEPMIYKQVENSFTQPNADVNESMLSWAVSCTREAKGDLLEMYCGNGNFSLALAKNFDRVLATEIAKPSVEAAQYNIQENKLENVKILRMSAEEFTQAMNGVREFRRLAGIDLKSYNCETIFVDPPRSGLDEDSVRMIQQYPTILYISCNPETLQDNLDILHETHKIERFALFDQFPYTHHMEAGVLLTRR